MSSSSSYLLAGRSWQVSHTINDFGDVGRLLRCYGIVELDMGG